MILMYQAYGCVVGFGFFASGSPAENGGERRMSRRSATKMGVPSKANQVVTTSPGEMVKIPGGAEPKRGLRVSDQ